MVGSSRLLGCASADLQADGYSRRPLGPREASALTFNLLLIAVYDDGREAYAAIKVVVDGIAEGMGRVVFAFGY